MTRSIQSGLVVFILSAIATHAVAAPASPATKPVQPQATVRPQTWEQDNERLKAQIARLTATAAELEKRPAPATRPAPAAAAAATMPTSRPVTQLIAENRRLVGGVNALLERIRRAENKPVLSKGVGDISISFTCEGHTVDEISELLGLCGQLASEQDGTVQYEWLFKIQENGHPQKIAAIQPWVCEVVDGKIVKNQMLERRPLGGVRRETPQPAAAKAPRR
jgi:hypothetical protein